MLPRHLGNGRCAVAQDSERNDAWMKLSLWRITSLAGVASAAVLTMGSLAMAKTTTSMGNVTHTQANSQGGTGGAGGLGNSSGGAGGSTTPGPGGLPGKGGSTSPGPGNSNGGVGGAGGSTTPGPGNSTGGKGGTAGSQTPSVVTNTTQGAQGSISITETSPTTGTATWSWSGLTPGSYVEVFAFPKGSPNQASPLSANNGYVKTPGSYTTNITLPSGDNWGNTGIEMTTGAFATGQLPEVPWAAGLPLLIVLPFGISMWHRRRYQA